MKKILFIILLFLCVKVNASENVNVKVEYVPNVYFSYKENGLTMWGQFAYIYSDGVLSYCIDIKTPVTKTSYTVDNSIEVNKNVRLIAYFGYGYDYNSYKTLKDYMATQKLIWKELGTDVVFTTQSKGKGYVIDISSNVNRILDTMKDYDKLPFYNYKLEFLLGATYRISDSNYVDRNNYQIIDNSGNIVTQEPSYIMQFIAKELGSNSLRVKRKYINRFDNIALVASNSQNIIRVGSIEDIYRDYEYLVKEGSVNINLTDAISNSKTNTGLATYDGIIFDMYDTNNNLISSVASASNGILRFDNLSFGNYIIRARNFNTYEDISLNENVDINKTTYNYNYNYALTPKSINLKLIKKYKENGIEKNDGDIIFEIYNSKMEKQEITTNEYGEASALLYYDNYKILQKSDSKILKKYEFNIDTNDFTKKDKVYIMDDSIINAKIKIELEDDTGMKICNSKVLINDKEYITDINGIVLTDYIDFKEYIIDANNDLYDVIDKEIINIDENSEFVYDNEDAFVYLKIKLNKKQIIVNEPKIISGDNNEENNNNDNGNINNNDNNDNGNINNNDNKTNNDKILDNINNVEDNMSKNNTIDKIHSIKTLPYLSSNSYFKGAKWVKEYLYCY